MRTLAKGRGAFLVVVAGLAVSAYGQDVTRPGDTIVGSSTNYPGAETPDGAIDNIGSSKYLNFDELNTGFTVTPSGTGIVRGLMLMTANDAPERDPTSYILEGSDDGVNFTPIASGNLNPPTARYGLDQVSFPNSTSYVTYRLTFPTIRNPAAANSMQVAEVQLLTATDILTPGDPFTITYTPGANSGANEGAANLFDNRGGTKLGVFNGNLGPTIIDVGPGVGASTVTGLDIFGGADDANFGGRTPAYVTLSGSNDGVNYTQIFTTALVGVTRNYQDQDFGFANAASYTSYRIELGPSRAATFLQVGEIQLLGVAANAPPANDTCVAARTITAGDTAGSNFNATGTDTTDCGTNDTTDVWYRYVATATGPVEVNTFGPGVLDTTLAVYTTCGGAALGCDDNSRGAKSRVTFGATSGQAYLIRVAGAGESTGTFTLTIDDHPVTHTDARLGLNYNFNGMVHAGEDGQPDNPDGFRSISDRGMRITGGVGSLEVGLEGTTGIPYNVVGAAGTLDIVHLGNRNETDNGNHYFDADPDGDDVGIQPNWLPDVNQTFAQTTDVSGLGLVMAGGTRIGVLYNASNGGNDFLLTLGFTDNTFVSVTLEAPDWYGLQDVSDPQAGVERQVSMGTFFGSQDEDTGNTGVDLNIVEAIVGTQSLMDGGYGDFTGKQLASVTFEAALFTQSAIAVYAATVRDAGSACRADFNDDGFVDFFDFNAFVDCFEGVECPPGKTADFNGDGFPDFFDFNDFVDAFDTGC